MTTIPHGNFGLIYADPPWAYTMFSDKGYAKSPEAHYRTMPPEDLTALRDSILFAAGADCVLFMWAVWPLLPQAMALMADWGFSYKTGGAWCKTTVTGKQAFGAGYILRSASEPFLIGTTGRPKIKNKSTRNALFTGDAPDDLNDLGICLTARTREHSRKPDDMAKTLEALFDGPYLELFARQKRQGWTVWGNETDKFSEEETKC